MKNIFITGDRSMEPVAAAGMVKALMQDLIEQYGHELAVGTGNAAFGVERAVRYIVPEGQLNVFPYDYDEDEKPDFEAGFRQLEDQTHKVVFLHIDPLSSHIGRALAGVFPPEKVSMPFQEAGLLL